MALLLSASCHQYNILNKICNLIRTSKRSAVDLAHDIFGPLPAEGQKNIIALHGLLGSKKNWLSLAIKIAAKTNASVITADARNHGDSPHHNTHTYLELAEDVSKLQETLSLSKTHIIGHSMGGRTAMALALTKPSKVQSLIIVDISPIPRKPSPVNSMFPAVIKAMMTVNFAGADSAHKARAIALKTLVDEGFDKKILSVFLMNIGKRQDNTFGWKYNLDTIDKSVDNIARFPNEFLQKRYGGPTLFLGGGKSDYLLKSHEPAIKKIFPEAIVTYIEHVGHNAHMEDSAAFLNIVFSFYAKHLR